MEDRRARKRRSNTSTPTHAHRIAQERSARDTHAYKGFAGPTRAADFTISPLGR